MNDAMKTTLLTDIMNASSLDALLAALDRIPADDTLEDIIPLHELHTLPTFGGERPDETADFHDVLSWDADRVLVWGNDGAPQFYIMRRDEIPTLDE